MIAAALATGAGVLLIEDPLAALPAEGARSFARIVVRALSDRRMVVFAPRVSLDSPLALAAEEAIVIDGSRVVAQGAPAEIAAGESAFVLRVGGDARAFVSAVEAQGGRLLATGDEPPIRVATPSRSTSASCVRSTCSGSRPLRMRSCSSCARSPGRSPDSQEGRRGYAAARRPPRIARRPRRDDKDGTARADAHGEETLPCKRDEPLL